MKWLIILLLILLLLVLYSRYKKLIAIISGQLDRKKTTLPNEIIVDTQRITDVTKRDNLIQWLLDRGYTEKRVFELADQVRLHLFNRNDQGSVIDLLTKGDDAEFVNVESKVDLEGGTPSDVEFNKYLLFPEQRIEFPDFSKWFKKCAKKRKSNNQPSDQKDKSNYTQNEGSASKKPFNDRNDQNSNTIDSHCRQITKTRFNNAPAGSSITFDQGAGPHSVKIGLIDSRADFTQFSNFEETLGVADLYIQYLQDGSNDFDELNLSTPEAHGTFMASIIANKYIGDSTLKIRSYPFHDGEKGHLMEVIAAIYSSIQQGVDILNLSLGYADMIRDEHLQRALIHAQINDVLVVCAAGNTNSNNDNQPFWPANFSSMSNVVTVGATDSAGSRWLVASNEGSNYGDITVSLATLGDALIGYVNATDLKQLSGTSCAAAVLASAAAAIKSASPMATAAEIKVDLLAKINAGDGIFSSEAPAMA